MKNLYRLVKSMLGMPGEKSKQTDRNIVDFVSKGKTAKIKIDNMVKIQKTQTYYIAKGMGVLK